MSLDKFVDQCNEASFLPDDLELQVAAKDYLSGRRMPVVKTGWPAHDGNFGLLWGQITAIGGYANYGKGTFIRQMMLQISLSENVNSAIWCPEDMPVEYAYMDLVNTYTGLNTEKPKQHDFIGDKRGMEMFHFIRERFFIIDSVKWKETSLDSILTAFDKLYNEYGCRLFLIDPYKDIDQDSMVRDDFRVHDNIKKMRKFVQGKKAHLFVVLHLKSPTAKSGEDPKIPTYNDLHYGSEWSKSLDNLLFWHHETFFSDRMKPERILAISKCKKRKIQGMSERFDMEWEWFSNRVKDNDGKCSLPTRTPNVELETNRSGIPVKAIERAQEINDLETIEGDKLPF